MRLINADNLEYFAHEECFGTDEQICEWIREVGFDTTDELEVLEEKLKQLCWKVLEGCMCVIRSEPTAYDVDKVTKEIKYIEARYCDFATCDYGCENCDHGVMMREIIKAVEDGEVNE